MRPTKAVPRFAARTHPGRVRKDNEDSIGWNTDHGLWVVADGMGGHAAGDVASRITAESIVEWAPREGLEPSLRRAHDAVRDAAARDSRLKGMGSTVVVAQVTGDLCEILWLGDSRAYLWREGTLRQLTRDHSFLEELRQRMGDTTVKNVAFSTVEVNMHPHRHVVTRAVGMTEPRPGLVRELLHRGDRILLVSDGLNDELSDADIGALLAQSDAPDTAAQSLLDAALEHGGHDNVSVIVIDPGKLPRKKAPVSPGALATTAALVAAATAGLRRLLRR